ncbi:glycerol-1-phosphate dehydrogenase [Sulfolobales archaeon HS-7]|nr:glycerol-1-phosphate dehydrogenase [Sulfolobales archaeon HS-7]
MDSVEHIIGLPMRVYIGHGIVRNLEIYLEQLRATNCNFLVITGPHVRSILESAVSEFFMKNTVDVITVEKADLDEVEKVEEILKQTSSKVIIGVGGGKVIDVAKYTAYRANVDFISVPTSPSHDGITSPFASIKGLGRPISVKAKEPLAIIADIEVLAKAPSRLIKAGIGDTIGKIISIRDWQLAHKLRGEYYASYTASLALLSAKHSLSAAKLLNVNRVEAVRILMEALISSGVAMGMAGSSRPASGSEHLFAHAVEVLEPGTALHGELVGIGTIIMSYIHNLNWRKIRRTLSEIDFPVTAKQLGIKEESFIKALTIAHTIRPERFTILGDKGITEHAAINILKSTGIIQ